MGDINTNLTNLQNYAQRVSSAKTAIANAITSMGGTVGANDGLENFATDIGTISTVVAKETVNFYDYDGTIVRSMSSAQFRSLESMPDNPTHEGLTAQGWNWSLADAKTYVAEYGSLDIGQQYITNDGKTRIYIKLSEGRISPILQLYLNANSELDIDWGDGSTHSTFTTTSAGYVKERHSYPTEGDYVILITVVSGSFIFQSQSTSYNTFFTDGKSKSNSSDKAYLNSIQKIEIGSGVTTIQAYAFQNCYSLSSVTIPNSVTSIGSNAFQNCYSLSSVTIPNSVTTIGGSAFSGCSYMDYFKFIPIKPPSVSASNAFPNLSTSTILYVPALVANLYMKGTNYPSESTYTYIGFATYESGETLPNKTTDETYTLTWYTNVEDAKAGTNPITTGTGNEVYAIATAI